MSKFLAVCCVALAKDSREMNLADDVGERSSLEGGRSLVTAGRQPPPITGQLPLRLTNQGGESPGRSAPTGSHQQF